jgi:tRNA threonylcarbamoyladenosine biosynthesis protein TsaE
MLYMDFPHTFTLNTITTTARNILDHTLRSGVSVLALSGDLGAGKTTLTKSIGFELGIQETIVSPTFVVAKFYKIHNPDYPWKQLLHIDAYRLESWVEITTLRLDEEFTNPQTLVILEWPEHITDTNQENWIHFSLEQKNDIERILNLD